MPARSHHRPHFAAPAVAFAVGTVAALALSSCSSPAPTGRAAVKPATLLSQAQSAVAQQVGVHLKGTVTSTNGQASDRIRVDSIGNQGNSAQGTIQASGPGLSFDGTTKYVIIGTTIFVSGDKTFWTSMFSGASPAEAKALMPSVVNHWIELNAAAAVQFNDAVLGLALPTSWLAKSVDLTSGTAQVTLTNKGEQNVLGQTGIEISASTGASILVAKSGPPLPLAISATNAKNTVSFQLTTTFGAQPKISAPSPFQQLSILQSHYFNSQGG